MSELAHEQVAAEGARPDRWMLFLHGILGTGTNWRSFARRLVRDLPGWGALLVDLRMHGGSQGLSPPHTVSAAAGDLEALERRGPGPIRAVLGHSFGGKVAIAYAGLKGEALTNLFVLDSNPGARPEARASELTVRVLAALDGLPRVFPSREQFIEAVASKGFDVGIARWLAMNLRREADAYLFGLDLAAIHALLEDYVSTDLWPVLEGLPPAVAVDVVAGAASEVFDAPARARLAALAARRPGVRLTVLEGAGHWVHVDDPEGVYRAIRSGLA